MDSQTMTIWEEKKIQGITLPADKLDRKKYADFLTSFLEKKYLVEKRQGSYIINLNAKWGSGKTYFIKRWMDDLSKNHLTIYIDSWKNDTSNNAFVTIISRIISEIEKYLPYESHASKIKETSAKIAYAAIPGILSAMLKHYTGIDVKNDGFDFSKAIEDGAKRLIDEHQKKQQTIDELKRRIEAALDKLTTNDKNNHHPSYIFIDELDRCRPNFAIDVLEAVKHIFNLEKVVFVIATDSNELQHSIKSIYGSGFNANNYLERFFDREITLPKSPYTLLITEHLESEFGQLDIENLNIFPHPTTHMALYHSIANILYLFDIKIRQAKKISNNIVTCLITSNEDALIDYIYLTTLFSMRELNRELYEELYVNRTHEKY